MNNGNKAAGDSNGGEGGKGGEDKNKWKPLCRCYPSCTKQNDTAQIECIFCRDSCYHAECRSAWEIENNKKTAIDWGLCYQCHPSRDTVCGKNAKKIERLLAAVEVKHWRINNLCRLQLKRSLGPKSILSQIKVPCAEALGNIKREAYHMIGVEVRNWQTSILEDCPDYDAHEFFRRIKQELKELVLGLLCLEEERIKHHTEILANAMTLKQSDAPHQSDATNAQTHCPNIDNSMSKDQTNIVIPKSDQKFIELCQRVGDEASWCVLFLAANMEDFRPENAELHVGEWEHSTSGLIQIVGEFVFQKCLSIWRAQGIRHSFFLCGNIIKNYAWDKSLVDLETIIIHQGKRIAAPILRRSKFKKWRGLVGKSPKPLSELAAEWALCIARNISKGVYTFACNGGVSLLQVCWESCKLKYTDRKQTACVIVSTLFNILEMMKRKKEEDESE